ncbi:MAG: hypothetical protein K6G32_12495 [Prevotella sp.]|nr:hypothetical protein [Prevotella sp.]
MENQLFIRVKTEKSNRSENDVWVISTQSHKKKYCRNALTALRYAFILKKQTGRRIADDAFEMLMTGINARKSQIQEPVNS